MYFYLSIKHMCHHTSVREQIHFDSNLKRILTYLVQMKFLKKNAPEMFALRLNYVTSCMWLLQVDRLCLNCNRMGQAECECPCECPLAMDFCNGDLLKSEDM